MSYKCDECHRELPNDHLLGQTVGTIPNARACDTACAIAWEASRPQRTDWEWQPVSEWVTRFRRGLREHQFFTQPSDDDIIWRYMDFAKLLDLLQTSELHLAAAHQLGDPFEGSLSDETLKRFERAAADAAQKFAEVAKSYDIDDGQQFMLQGFRGNHAWERQWTYVSCWHINVHESAAMWAAYGKRSDSIAVRSTMGRLRCCIEQHQEPPHGFPLMAKVRYLDYAKEAVETGCVLAPLLQKRKSFEHEHELRVLLQRLPHMGTPGIWGQRYDAMRPPVPGVRLAVDLSVLIEGIFVAPDAAPWFLKVVRELVAKYSLTVDVTQSALLEGNPVF